MELTLPIAFASIIGFIVLILYFLPKSKPPQEVLRRVPQFNEFLTLLTDEKTATQIGSSQMKSLRKMLALKDLEPAVLRAWSRAIREKNGQFLKIRPDTCQMQIGSGEEISSVDKKPFCQIVAQAEFIPLKKEKNNKNKKKEDENDENEKNIERRKRSRIQTAGVLLRWHQNEAVASAVEGALSTSNEKEAEEKKKTEQDENSSTHVKKKIFKPASGNKNEDENNLEPFNEPIIGFHVLPLVASASSQEQDDDDDDDEDEDELMKNKEAKARENNKKNVLASGSFDIMSNIDPQELDNFCERAVDLLFDQKSFSDPMREFLPYCVGPLRQLYMLEEEEEEEEEKGEKEQQPKQKEEEEENNHNESTKKKKQSEEDGFDHIDTSEGESSKNSSHVTSPVSRMSASTTSAASTISSPSSFASSSSSTRSDSSSLHPETKKEQQEKEEMEAQKQKQEKEKEEKEKFLKNEQRTKTTLTGLPPSQRRRKLASDLLAIRQSMGLVTSQDYKKSSTTMSQAEFDTKAFSNAKSICARVTVTGSQRDCVVTLQLLLDPVSSFGLSVGKYGFTLGANKQKMMLYDQDAGETVAVN